MHLIAIFYSYSAIHREEQRSDYHLSVLVKQIKSIAFFSKLDVGAQWELCKVMKVQSHYRKDRGGSNCEILFHVTHSSNALCCFQCLFKETLGSTFTSFWRGNVLFIRSSAWLKRLKCNWICRETTQLCL